MWKPEPVEAEEEEEGAEGGLDTIREPEDEQKDEDLLEAEREALEASEDKKMFDAINGGGPINMAQAAGLARQLGMSPSYADVNKFSEKHGDSVDWITFSKFRSQLLHPDDKLDNFVAAFAYFDPNSNGFLTLKQMKNILSTFGEPLNEQEAELVLGQFCSGGDQVDYRAFCEKILARD